MEHKENGFEARERLRRQYWDDPRTFWNDPRWQEVRKLRINNEHAKANGLVFKIRQDWGLE